METIIELLERSVAAHGDRPALIIKPGFRTRTWTYAQIGEQVPRAAHLLREAGLEPGDRVLVWAPNRPEWGISFLAVLWAGGVVVPFDFRTADELALKIASQTKPRLVLASAKTIEAARRLELPALAIESLIDRARDPSVPALPRPNVAPDDLAEIVFTSGTTGDPKGVMLSHRNIASNASATRTVIPLGPETRILGMLPMSHMYGLNPAFLVPMIAGAAVVYPTSIQPPVLARTFREQRVTFLASVPQVVKILTNRLEREVDARGRRALFERMHALAVHLPMTARRLLFRSVLSQMGGALRYFAVGAAPMNPNVARRWENMGVVSLQGYGATELSPVVSYTRLERNLVGTVGEAIPGVEIRIAGDGEILVRGPNVFQGYWQRPEQTAAVIDAAGWYHTGDTGMLDGEGFLTLQGRKKDMVVMPDGTKVHPLDIEQVLIRDPHVRDAAVAGVERSEGEVQIHAFLILTDDADAAAVVEEANRALGAHQQIRGWTVWTDDDFPRNHMMKVRKQDLVAWLDRRSESEQPKTISPLALAAATGVERLLRQIEGVAIDAIRPEARLSSDLGLDSLGRVELLTLIEEDLGVSIDDGEVEPDDTVASLQARVDAASGEARPPEGIFAWPLHPIVGVVRSAIQALLMRPFVSLLYRRRVRGLEHLEGLEAPVMFAPNHHLHFDNLIILSSIPARWRRRLAMAASAERIFGNGVQGFIAAVAGNAFPLAREGAVRHSLDLLGARLDRGFNVLIYPEGKLTVGGPLQEFKTGTGLVAVLGATPVVPVRLIVHRPSRFDAGMGGRSWRGDVEVVFGAPLRFPIDADPVEATERIRIAVASLGG